MLVGLNFTDDFSIQEKVRISTNIADKLSKTAVVLEPKTRQEFQNILKTYKPRGRKHIVLTSTHYQFEESSSAGEWRIADHFFSGKGGIVFGAEPPHSVNTYAARIPTDLNYVLGYARHLDNRAKYVSDTLPGYFGRKDSDPHTIIVGVRPSYQRMTKNLINLIGTLSESWWAGVGFFTPTPGNQAEQQLTVLTETFDYATLISVDFELTSILTKIEARFVSAGYPKFRTLAEYETYTRELRELARVDQLIVVE